MVILKTRFWRNLLGGLAIGILALGGLFYAGQKAIGQESGEQASTTDEAAPEAEDQAKDAEQADKGKDKDGKKEKAPIPVEAVAAERGSVSAYITATANLVAESHVTVRGETEGTVLDFHAEEGEWVGKGQVLVTLNRDDAEIGLDKAHARAANARLAWERIQTMRDADLVSTQDFERVSMEHRVTEQEVAEAEWMLSRRTIRAPFAGRITERFAQAGQRIKPNDELYTIVDYDPLVARIYLPESEVLSLEVGREVMLALNADETIQFQGRIRMISPIVDTATGTVKVTIEAVEPPANVRPGGFVTVNIVKERRDDVLRLPREAVIRELRTAHVFVVNGDKAAKRQVVTGLEEGDTLEVVSGLESGEQVVTAGQGALRDGTAVKVLENEASPRA